MARIIVDGQDASIPEHPLTLLFTSPETGQISYPGRAELHPELTVRWVDMLREEADLHPTFRRAFAIWCGAVQRGGPDPDITVAGLQSSGTGLRHVAGLIDLTLHLRGRGIPVVWVHPESHLHPAWQCGLGDLIMWLTYGEPGPACSGVPQLENPPGI